jgi:hypothetical protein
MMTLAMRVIRGSWVDTMRVVRACVRVAGVRMAGVPHMRIVTVACVAVRIVTVVAMTPKSAYRHRREPHTTQCECGEIYVH